MKFQMLNSFTNFLEKSVNILRNLVAALPDLPDLNYISHSVCFMMCKSKTSFHNDNKYQNWRIRKKEKVPKLNHYFVQFCGQLCCYWHVCMSLRMSERKQSQAHFTFSLVMEVSARTYKGSCARTLLCFDLEIPITCFAWSIA